MPSYVLSQELNACSISNSTRFANLFLIPSTALSVLIILSHTYRYVRNVSALNESLLAG